MSWNIQKPGDYINGPLTVTGSATISGDLTVRTNKLAVTSTGVGFGTASPATSIDVASGNLQVRTGGSVVSDTFTNYGAALQINSAGSLPLRLLVSGNKCYEIDASYVQTWLDGAGGTRMTLNSTGLGVGVTPSAGRGCLQLSSGITFPATQVASSDVNTLDDYEEGTWTPTITASVGTPTTTTINLATYTKIGRIVSATFDISIVNLGTASGLLQFTLPFSQGTDNNIGCLREVGATALMGQVGSLGALTSFAALYNNATVWVNGYRIRGTYTYTV